MFTPRSGTNIGSAGRGAPGAARASRTSPVILRRVDTTGAGTRTIQSTNVSDANLAAPQIVEMDVDHGRRVHGDIDVLINIDVREVVVSADFLNLTCLLYTSPSPRD